MYMFELHFLFLSYTKKYTVLMLTVNTRNLFQVSQLLFIAVGPQESEIHLNHILL